MDEGRLAGIAAAMSMGYIDNSEGSLRKQTVIERLKELRGGPYGIKRQIAKDKTVSRFNDMIQNTGLL